MTRTREEFIKELDEELLVGGYILSEWCVLIVQQCDIAFCARADLAVVITSVAGIEAYMKSEYGAAEKTSLYHLVEGSSLTEDLKLDIHNLRKYRNGWVHVSDPANDDELLSRPEAIQTELEVWSKTAMRTLRRTIYENPFV